MLPSLAAGFALGLSLIVAIGAQNLFVLRQGVRREHVAAVATVCAVSDAALIAAGVSGLGLVLQAVPWLIDVVRWAGAVFLLGYALLAARRAWRPSGAALRATAAGGAPAAESAPATPDGAVSTGTRLGPVLLTCLALTWLNPHVYLDTVFLLGSVASTHGDHRWVFAAGAMTASVVWFFALAYGSRVLGRWLATPRAWRVLDGIIAVVMAALAVSLVLPR
ncbi:MULTISPECIES: LysE/ArgO family amino acid transporter [unclassified Microbacterium]|uniref:LysE/ArgO family amino acid transporter n=1 Tax=unclassified Microbacterium TaxID=2609290 RepID=UPI00214B858E|nr:MULTISPECIES: LysE/ArgO family amino acid transporter [unclassified Microbacterium]MCR2783813.1 LysE/ArgO family amino acid transporter [Microbacterium sp. zg.B96]MDL5351395.1 LysE/ArgO family amino acid transporter [Microbacterium sp. zg-YB36]WIM15337.1 LysE/ArgO family amino acid transporter [Microbacterium sp. zg-B96]